MPRKKTRLILAATITGALAASVIVVANAGADTVATPGRVEAESSAAQSGAQVEGTSDTGAAADPASTPPTTPASSPPATGDGWVPIDQAKWDKQLAEYEATPAQPVPAGNVRVPEFNASCTISHRRPDDPIVFPGMPGASHLHTFWGNKSAGAATTNESLFANPATTCDPADDDFSAYWIPTLLENGQPVDPHGVTVYYGSRLKDPTATKPFPEGFRMIVGDAKRQVDTPKGAPAQFWCAGAGGETGRSTDGNWPVCAGGF